MSKIVTFLDAADPELVAPLFAFGWLSRDLYIKARGHLFSSCHAATVLGCTAAAGPKGVRVSLCFVVYVPYRVFKLFPKFSGFFLGWRGFFFARGTRGEAGLRLPALSEWGQSCLHSSSIFRAR
jgi:hypothetical protein